MKIHIGPHEITVEQDVLIAYVSGPWLLPDMVEFLMLCERTYAQLGSVYLVTIVGPGYNLPQESRKYIADWGRSHPITGNVIAGAPFAMRALIGIISRGAQLIGSASAKVTFTETEAEALDWVAQHKRRSAG